MCDDFIHQGLTHDPTVSRRTFMVASAATVMLTSANAGGAGQGRREGRERADGVRRLGLCALLSRGERTVAGGARVDRHPGSAAGLSGDGADGSQPRATLCSFPIPFYRNAKAPVVDGSFDFSKA